MPPQHHEADQLLTETVRAVAVAWRNLAAYPPDHPLRTRTLEAAHSQLAELAGLEGRVVLGVARDGLRSGETKLDSLPARRLAQALYDRDVAILRVDAGVQPGELEALLRLLAAEPRGGDQAPLGDRLEAGPHLHLELVDYSAVRVTDELRPPGSPSPVAEPESLWDVILRALLAGQHLSGEADPSAADHLPRVPPGAAPSGAELAAMIGDYLREAEARADAAGGSGPVAGPGAREGGEGGDGAEPGGSGPGARLRADLSATIGAAVGSYLAAARAQAHPPVIHQAADFLRGLPPAVRETVLHSTVRALAADESGAEALEALSRSMAPDAILKALRRLRLEGAKLSRHALHLARTLAAVAAGPPATESADLREQAAALRAELLSLFRDEDIDRYNPDDHQALFEQLSIELPELAPLAPGTPADLGDRVESLEDDALAEQLAGTLLDMLGRPGGRDGVEAVLARLEVVFQLFLTGARFGPATEVVEVLQQLSEDPQVTPAAHRALLAAVRRLGSQETLARLVESLPQLSADSVTAVKRLIDRLGAVAVENLLLVLIQEPSRPRRRRIFNLLAALGPVVVPHATPWLSDPRWYVVRNMIVLLRTIGDQSSLPRVRGCASHPDLRVRLEAFRTLVRLDAHATREILEKAINDPDRQVAEAMVALAGESGSAEAVGPLVTLLARWDPFGRRRAIRLKALRALGELADPAALPGLDRLFRERRVPIVSIEERRVAFATLESYPEPVRRPLVERGLLSRDPEIRRTCQRLAESGG